MIIPYQKAQVSFRLGERIGLHGEQSEVYKAHDEHLDADLAIKQIKTDGFNEECYLEEAQMLYKSAHPYVVQVLYACKGPEHLYIAMPFYANGSLGEVARSVDLTCKEILRYAIQFVSGINNIHSKGLIHFDIKPDNIMISDSNEALISDFGFAKNMDEDGFATPKATYTEHLPPEAAETVDMDNRSDIYQIGMTLYRLIAKSSSIEDQRATFKTGAEFAKAQFQNKFPDFDCIPVHIPKAVTRIIKKCLKYDPDARYQSAIELLNALASIPDHALDWIYTRADDADHWESTSSEGSAYLVKLSDTGVCEATKCALGGKFRRRREFCVKSPSWEDLHGMLVSTGW